MPYCNHSLHGNYNCKIESSDAITPLYINVKRVCWPVSSKLSTSGSKHTSFTNGRPRAQLAAQNN